MGELFNERSMVKARIAEYILKITPKSLKKIYESKVIQKYESKLEYARLSFSQEGEDIILSRFFEHKDFGFFVDIGAHHPKRFSNTFYFYKRGWRGINIDAMPGSMIPFQEERPEDINLEIGVSETEQTLTYFQFNEPALNTFSETEASLKDGRNGYFVQKRIPIETQPLATILDKHLATNQSIDFMSIDVEGLDLAVLKSNNWEKYKPTMVIIESLRNNLEKYHENTVYDFLHDKQYSLVAKTFNTLFFRINE